MPLGRQRGRSPIQRGWSLGTSPGCQPAAAWQLRPALLQRWMAPGSRRAFGSHRKCWVGFFPLALAQVCWSPQGWRERPQPLRGEPSLLSPQLRGAWGFLCMLPAWMGGLGTSARAVPGRALACAGTDGLQCAVPF